MSYRSLMTVGAIVLLILAATTIDAPPIVWQPSWPVRLGMGGIGVLLALGALLLDRKRTAADSHRPAAERGLPSGGRHPE